MNRFQDQAYCKHLTAASNTFHRIDVAIETVIKGTPEMMVEPLQTNIRVLKGKLGHSDMCLVRRNLISKNDQVFQETREQRSSSSFLGSAGVEIMFGE